MLPKKVHTYNTWGSVRYASRGLKQAIKSEPNIRWQLFVFLISVVVSGIFHQWLFIGLHTVLAALVISTEILNTAFEYLCDLVEPQYSEQVKSIKDIAAGAVFFAALCWLVVILVEVGLILYDILI